MSTFQWNRNGCKTRVCVCHDDSVPPHRQYDCSMCWCRVVRVKEKAKSTASHPLPWYAGTVLINDAYAVYDANGATVARCAFRAQADRIATTANAQPALLEALCVIRDRGHRRCAALTGDESKACDCGVGEARAAIAKAEGRES